MDQEKEDWKESWIGWPFYKSKDTPKSEVKSLMGKNSGWFIAAAFFAIIALYKNLVYDLDAGINAYVGGDAYNFIINANKFVGWMVLSLILTIVGCTKTLVDAIKELKS